MAEKALIGIVTFIVAFILGAQLMLSSWKESAARGGFEIGHKLYRVEEIKIER